MSGHLSIERMTLSSIRNSLLCDRQLSVRRKSAGFDRLRKHDPEALRIANRHLLQLADNGRFLDAFGDDADPGDFTDANDGFQLQLRDRTGGDFAYDGAIDLDVFGQQRFERRERNGTPCKSVDHDLASDFAHGA